MDKLYTLNPRALWSQFRKEHFAFWMICLYLIMEYVRPQSIYPGLDFLPWDKVFLGLACLHCRLTRTNAGCAMRPIGG